MLIDHNHLKDHLFDFVRKESFNRYSEGNEHYINAFQSVAIEFIDEINKFVSNKATKDMNIIARINGLNMENSSDE